MTLCHNCEETELERGILILNEHGKSVTYIIEICRECQIFEFIDDIVHCDRLR
ncbi:MAG: hypothetical protein PHZ19_03620 [Candidatus Thermoplasmatota archaeon]|nr:hypothetical protein [Candidatus Thermoplasmatota archaeon]